MGFATYLLAFVAAYLAAVAFYTTAVWVITREGRGLLMHGDCMNVTFYSQLSAAWAFTAIVAAAVAMRLSHGGNPGQLVACLTAVALALAVLRNHTKAKHEQSRRITLLLIGCIAAGTAAVCVLMPGMTP